MFYFGSANIEALFYFAKPLLIKTEVFHFYLIFSLFQRFFSSHGLVSKSANLVGCRNGYIVKKWYNCVQPIDKKLSQTFEIKPVLGLSDLLFGSSMSDAEKIFGKAEESEFLDDIEDCQSTVWHYWEQGFSLFFDEKTEQIFCCVEIDNEDVILWGQKIFSFSEKQIVDLFKSKGITEFETELHEWGEKRLSFDEANIDFYFEKNKLCSINYGKSEMDLPLILPN